MKIQSTAGMEEQRHWAPSARVKCGVGGPDCLALPEERGNPGALCENCAGDIRAAALAQNVARAQMPARAACDVSNMTLDELRALGVSEVEFGAGTTRISFFRSSVAPQPSAATPVMIPIPSTPEQSGKSDPADPEPPKKDIFDVLASGEIPGAPSRDGLAGTPGSG